MELASKVDLNSSHRPREKDALLPGGLIAGNSSSMREDDSVTPRQLAERGHGNAGVTKFDKQHN